MKSKVSFVLLVAFCFISISCSPSEIPLRELSLPEVYGVYVHQGNKFVPLDLNPPEESPLNLEGDEEILIFKKEVGSGIIAMYGGIERAITLSDRFFVRSEVLSLRDGNFEIEADGKWKKSQSGNLNVRFRPVEDNSEMIIAFTEEPLERGVYVWKVFEESFPFSVDIDLGDFNFLRATDSCKDRHVAFLSGLDMYKSISLESCHVLDLQALSWKTEAQSFLEDGNLLQAVSRAELTLLLYPGDEEAKEIISQANTLIAQKEGGMKN